MGDDVNSNYTMLCVLAAIRCGPLQYVENAAHTPVDDRYGEHTTFTCLDGYWFTKNIYQLSVRCEDSGQWSANATAQCKGT